MSTIGLDRWLQHLREHLPIAKEGRDPEGVHQVRVAVRRLRVWLRLAGLRVLEDDLAWLVRAAGEVRDLEVLLQNNRLPKAFRRWAASRLKEARARFEPLLETPRLAGLLQALSNLPPLDTTLAQARLKRFFTRLKEKPRSGVTKKAREPARPAPGPAAAALRQGVARAGEPAHQAAAGGLRSGGRPELHPALPSHLRVRRGPGAALYKKQLETQLRQALEAAREAWQAHQAGLG